MTTEEFNTQFDVLYNNIASNSAPGLNTYEKSVFLTKAQTEILKNYFIPQGNTKQLGIDDSSKRQFDFYNIIVDDELDISPVHITGQVSVKNHLSLSWPADVLAVLNEELYILDVHDNVLATRQVIPISHTEYLTLMSKPFAQPLKRQAWRLLSNNDHGSESIVVITYSDKKLLESDDANEVRYIVRYVTYPPPIILEDLSEYEVTIEGESTARTSVLDARIHPEILQRAVELAKASWQGDLNASLTVGARTE